MIDRVGTLETALQRAANRAGVERYKVIRPDTLLDLGLLGLAVVAEGGDGSQHVRTLLDPEPGLKSPADLAFSGTLPQEQILVPTAGEPPQQRITAYGSEDR